VKVAVLGASPKTHRYSNMALRRLAEQGYHVLPVNPAHESIEGIPAVRSLEHIGGDIHTLTVYVGPRHIGPEIDRIVRLRPKRVILNPGAESPELAAALDSHGIPWMQACTLVMLATNQF
jgi:predicted CoA-binding protein